MATKHSRASALQEAVTRHRSAYSRREAKVLKELAEAWKPLVGMMDSELKRLTKILEAGDPTELESWRRDRLQRLMNQLNTRISVSLGETVRIIDAGKRKLGASALDDFGDLMQSQVDTVFGGAMTISEGAASRIIGGSDRLLATWARLPVAALREITARTLGGPVVEVLAKRYAAYATEAAETLRYGIAVGQNPRRVAQTLNRLTNEPYHISERVARTEMINSYREVRRSTMQENPQVVTGWVWIAQIDDCCGSCLAMHGTVHDSDEILESHPNCRCDMLPQTVTWSDLGFEDIDEIDEGFEDEFRADAAKQLDKSKSELSKRFGPGKAELIKNGDVSLDDLTRRTYSDEWGGGRREATLRELSK